MTRRILTTVVVAWALIFGAVPSPAQADNPMGYRLLSAQDAANLPRNRGALGLDVERSQQITDSGMTFEVMRVMQVKTGSPGAQAGFRPGDQIIAVDGRVFPTITAFAAYVGCPAILARRASVSSMMIPDRRTEPECCGTSVNIR